MKFMFKKCRRTIYWAILFTGLLATGVPTANALIFGGFSVGTLCGPVNMEPVTIDVGTSYRFITASSTTSVLKAGTADRRIVRHFVVLKSLFPNGTLSWTRNLLAQSLAIAEVDLDDEPPSYSYPDTVDTSQRSVSPASFLSTECLGISEVTSGNKTYLAVSMGTMSSTGGSDPIVAMDDPMKPRLLATSNEILATIKGQDKTVLNISIINTSNGNIVRTFKPRAKPGHFFLGASSGIYDIDNDLNDELVLAYIKFIGDFRHDFVIEQYNILTGALKRTTTLTQYNQVKFQY